MKVFRRPRVQTHKTKVSKHFLMFFMFLALLLGKEMQLVAQDLLYPPRKPDFSNPIITSNCCPKYKNTVDNIINNAPFVLEGHIIKETYGIDYNYYLFEIEKVYRGCERLQSGTIEILTRHPDTPEEPPAVTFLHRWHVIFAKEIEGGGAFDANNSIKLELFYNDRFYNPSFFGEIEYEGKPIYHGLELVFKTKNDVYDFLTTYKLSSTDVSKADTLKTLSKREIEKLKEKEVREKEAKKDIHHKTKEEADSLIREIKRIKGYDWDTIPRKNINKTQKSGNRGSNGRYDLFVKLDSIKYTSNANERFLEFDIVGRADSTGSYPDVLNFVLYYESDNQDQPFGKNAQDIVVTQSPYFTGGNYF